MALLLCPVSQHLALLIVKFCFNFVFSGIKNGRDINPTRFSFPKVPPSSCGYSFK